MMDSSLSDRLFFTTAWIRASTESGSWTGTAFVYSVDTTSGVFRLLVTNRHVLENATAVTVRFIRTSHDASPMLGQATEVTIDGFHNGSWIGHPDPRIDVAVLPLSQILLKMEEQGAPPFFTEVGPAICMGVGVDLDLDSFEGVTFVGYPNGLYDQFNFLPIMRRGVTATPIYVDYGGLPAFLIDASVFPGSSGSPVFLFDKGMFSDRSGRHVTVGSRVALLGVLAAVHTRTLSGDVRTLSSRLVADLEEPIDLGVVYKAKCIDECADIALKGAGLRRAVVT